MVEYIGDMSDIIETTLPEGETRQSVWQETWHEHDWSQGEVLFVQGMMAHGNKMRAYKNAFKADCKDKFPSSYRRRVDKLLEQPHIINYLEAMQREIQARLVIDNKRILNEVASVAYANFTDFVVVEEDGRVETDLSGLTRDQWAAINELSIKTFMEKDGDDFKPVTVTTFKLAPKLAALELLGKHKKLWTDVIENSAIGDIAEQIRAARAERVKRRDREAKEENGSSEPQSITARPGATDDGDADEGQD